MSAPSAIQLTHDREMCAPVGHRYVVHVDSNKDAEPGTGIQATLEYAQIDVDRLPAVCVSAHRSRSATRLCAYGNMPAWFVLHLDGLSEGNDAPESSREQAS